MCEKEKKMKGVESNEIKHTDYYYIYYYHNHHY